MKISKIIYNLLDFNIKILYGINMKPFFILIFFLFNGLVFSACGESYFITEVKIDNKSSFDLRLSIIQHQGAWFDPNDNWKGDDIDIIKGSSVKIELHISMSGAERNPNLEFDKLIFSNASDSTIINEIENNNNFKLTREERLSMYGYKYYYLLEITDDLLLK